MWIGTCCEQTSASSIFLNNSVHWCEPDNINSISRSLISALNTKDDLSNIYENQRLIKENIIGKKAKRLSHII